MRNMWCFAGEAGHKDIKQANTNWGPNDSITRSNLVEKKWKLAARSISSKIQQYKLKNHLLTVDSLNANDFFQGLNNLNCDAIQKSDIFQCFKFQGIDSLQIHF